MVLQAPGGFDSSPIVSGDGGWFNNFFPGKIFKAIARVQWHVMDLH